MSFEFSKIKARKPEDKPIDPIRLFQSLRVEDRAINDLWLAQGDALREWHEHRDETDVSISLNTGAGKTLLGLLIGQSLVNETRSLILYACSSIQLVEQTAQKAQGYGLPVTTYIKSAWSNSLAQQGKAVCLTTYQALFNGKSIFFREDVKGVIFDDAHAAEHLLRDHFSLRLEAKQFPALYKSLSAEFSDYFNSVGLRTTYDDIVRGASARMLLIPPFALQNVLGSIVRLLGESEVRQNSDTTFAWEHLKDRIDLCACLMSSKEVTFTPPFVPVRTLPYFKKNVRRIYLSATLSGLDGFVRTFGRRPSKQIAPSTSAGECERMIIVPTKMQNVKNDVETAIEAIAPFKVLILVPSYGRAEEWKDLAQPPERSKATEVIEKFKSDKGACKLLLTARYDGMDLPGDMCRVVVIDDLPSGVGPLDRFLWEYLGFSGSLRTSVASRVVQSFGRISRGMSDHGVAIITGDKLIRWLEVPKNREALPQFLQKQLQLGFQMSEHMEKSDIPSNINSCLIRDGNWIQAYEAFMKEADHEEPSMDNENLTGIALSEAKYGEALWHREYQKAAESLQKTIIDASEVSLSTVSWHKLWLGFALDLLGDRESAKAQYRQAHTGQRNIAPLPSVFKIEDAESLSPQAVNAARMCEIDNNEAVTIPAHLHRDLAFLDGSGSFKQVEEAIRCLGQYLGFASSRPDKEYGTGPDIMWLSAAENVALCFDAKTGKKDTSIYRKEDLGQLADHVQWVRDNTDAATIIPGFIGPEVAAGSAANPQEGVKVASLRKFYALGEVVKEAYENATGSSLPLMLPQKILEEFERRKLLWPELQSHLNLIELRDL